MKLKNYGIKQQVKSYERDILWRDIGMNELMEKDLENAKKDLKDKQEKLQWFMEHEINSERFEYNMITVLTEMTGLKKKIKNTGILFIL